MTTRSSIFVQHKRREGPPLADTLLSDLWTDASVRASLLTSIASATKIPKSNSTQVLTTYDQLFEQIADLAIACATEPPILSPVERDLLSRVLEDQDMKETFLSEYRECRQLFGQSEGVLEVEHPCEDETFRRLEDLVNA